MHAHYRSQSCPDPAPNPEPQPPDPFPPPPEPQPPDPFPPPPEPLPFPNQPSGECSGKISIGMGPIRVHIALNCCHDEEGAPNHYGPQ